MTDKSNNIKAVIFDLGRVLVNIDNAFLLKELFKGLKVNSLQELGHKTMRDPAMVEFNTGRIDPQEFHRQMCEKYQLEPDFEIFKKLWCKIFYTMEGMEEVVNSLKGCVKIGLLSDTDPIHWGHIKATWPWISEIQNPTLSYEVGVMKPNAEIYLTAAQNVNTTPEHCLFVDDLEVNVEGARSIGMQAIRFENLPILSKYFEEIGLF